MRILIILGVFVSEWQMKTMWRMWRKELEEAFPGAEIIVLRDFYLWWEQDKIDRIVAEGEKYLHDEVPTIILAHSCGGVIAKTLIERVHNNNVKALVTMCTPHTYDVLGIDITKKYMGIPETVDVPTLTYGGYVDAIVPYKYSCMKGAPHKDFYADHAAFYLSKKIRGEVLDDLKQELAKRDL